LLAGAVFGLAVATAGALALMALWGALDWSAMNFFR
jgi:hypothetical protein